MLKKIIRKILEEATVETFTEIWNSYCDSDYYVCPMYNFNLYLGNYTPLDIVNFMGSKGDEICFSDTEDYFMFNNGACLYSFDDIREFLPDSIDNLAAEIVIRERDSKREYILLPQIKQVFAKRDIAEEIYDDNGEEFLSDVDNEHKNEKRANIIKNIKEWLEIEDNISAALIYNLVIKLDAYGMDKQDFIDEFLSFIFEY